MPSFAIYVRAHFTKPTFCLSGILSSWKARIGLCNIQLRVRRLFVYMFEVSDVNVLILRFRNFTNKQRFWLCVSFQWACFCRNYTVRKPTRNQKYFLWHYGIQANVKLIISRNSSIRSDALGAGVNRCLFRSKYFEKWVPKLHKITSLGFCFWMCRNR